METHINWNSFFSDDFDFDASSHLKTIYIDVKGFCDLWLTVCEIQSTRSHGGFTVILENFFLIERINYFGRRKLHQCLFVLFSFERIRVSNFSRQIFGCWYAHSQFFDSFNGFFEDGKIFWRIFASPMRKMVLKWVEKPKKSRNVAAVVQKRSKKKKNPREKVFQRTLKVLSASNLFLKL